MHQDKPRFPWAGWLVWTVLGAGMAALLMAFEGEAAELRGWAWASVLVGFAPLIGLQLWLGSPRAAQAVRAWLQATRRGWAYLAGGLTALWLVANLLAGHFNPYALAIVGFGLFAALGALREVPAGRPGLTWTDAAVWLFLWIPFDLRWSYDLWFGYGGGYNWWALALSVVAVLGWSGLRAWPDFGYRLVPRGRDVGIALLATAVFALIVIPIGLAIDFLTFPPSQPPTLTAGLLMFAGLVLTVAIPEELFFRGILQHGLDHMYHRRGWVLLGVSLAFGLMHWNNASDLTTRVAYTALATLAGVFYGWAYRRSGNNLLAPVLTHALVDTIWALFLQ